MVAFAVLLVLLVVGAVINGAWSAARSVTADVKIKQSLQQLASITAKLRDYSPQGFVDNEIGPALITAGIIPAEMVQGNSIRNVWAGEVVFSTFGAKDRKEHFTLTYRNIPDYDCALFIQRIGDQARNFSLFGIATSSGKLLTQFPVTDSDAQQACKYDINLLALVFKLNG